MHRQIGMNLLIILFWFVFVFIQSNVKIRFLKCWAQCNSELDQSLIISVKHLPHNITFNNTRATLHVTLHMN